MAPKELFRAMVASNELTSINPACHLALCVECKLKYRQRICILYIYFLEWLCYVFPINWKVPEVGQYLYNAANIKPILAMVWHIRHVLRFIITGFNGQYHGGLQQGFSVYPANTLEILQSCIKALMSLVSWYKKFAAIQLRPDCLQ